MIRLWSVVIIVAVLASAAAAAASKGQGDDKISANPWIVPFILSYDHDSLIPVKEACCHKMCFLQCEKCGMTVDVESTECNDTCMASCLDGVFKCPPII
ncbi:unnamed protein product [Prunus armeniaca]|uniref:Uncharacterized protein n=1 Tax=Prunus armeniaca TaxID=36596 RepID=A0A6J5UB85_PRUAR|nr:unnamed protein product [Prunus armeniaca]